MYRHISIFSFLSDPKNGKTKEENIRDAEEYLATVTDKYPAAKKQTVARMTGEVPDHMPADAPVILGDLVQIMDFDSKEDMDGYAPSDAHKGLIKLTELTVGKVAAIDYKI